MARALEFRQRQAIPAMTGKPQSWKIRSKLGQVEPIADGTQYQGNRHRRQQHAHHSADDAHTGRTDQPRDRSRRQQDEQPDDRHQHQNADGRERRE
jgi:hypothetical protein